ncbi:MAG: DMT family transporter [Bacteroidetes bacterium]|nr:MAG: DMT family transporter [Bacteroidota bacterium]
MIYLLLSVCASVLVVSYFKLFERFQVDVLQAIVVNYVTCSIMGNLMSDKPIVTTAFYLEPWFPYTLVLGFLFISIFYCIAQTAQKVGVSISMVAAKLSVAIPVLFAVMVHHEDLGFYKAMGILLSLIAVYFISSIQAGGNAATYWYLPLLVFAGSGCIDTLLTIINKQFIPPGDTNSILSVVFLTACVLGALLMAILRIKISLKSGLWGVALGVPNYFSMYFLLKTLQSFQESSIALPMNNIAILMSTALVGWVFFKEQLSVKKVIGLSLAIVSIVILSLYQ